MPTGTQPAPPVRVVGQLLEAHYLAEELPDVVTTGAFAAWYAVNAPSLAAGLPMTTTRQGTFSAPRSTATRRIVSLPHPNHQLALSVLIARNRRAIRAAIDGAGISLYSTKAAPRQGLAFRGIDFGARPGREASMLARHPVVLTADVANFFHTVYTHSLPWAVLGKKHVKSVREGTDKGAKNKLKAHWSSQLDDILQGGNARETFGIPVGPDTSKLIAELLLAGVQRHPALAPHLSGRAAYRLVDDFYVGFGDEAQAQACLDALRRAMWDFNLHLNDAKTKILHSRLMFDGEGEWRREMDGPRLDGAGPEAQRDALLALTGVAVRRGAERGDFQPALACCDRILGATLDPGNLGQALECLLRLARDYTPCMRHLTEFVRRHRAGAPFDGPGIPLMKAWLASVVASNGPRGHDFEVCWALAIHGLLGVEIDPHSLHPPGGAFSPVVLCYLGLLRAQGLVQGQGLLGETWDDLAGGVFSAERPALGGHWLPCYEAALRGWTADTRLVREVKADALLGRLLAGGVSFLDDTAVGSPQPSGRTFPGAASPGPRGTVVRRRRRRLDNYF